MAKTAFQIEGEFQMGRLRQHFVMQTVAADEKGAKDRVYATLGSRHGVNRRQVFLGTVKRLKADEVTDATADHELRAGSK